MKERKKERKEGRKEGRSNTTTSCNWVFIIPTANNHKAIEGVCFSFSIMNTN